MLKKIAAPILLVIILILGYIPYSKMVTESDNTNQQVIKDERAERIDAYFTQRKMPLAGYGKIFVEEADKNGIDWRLMPAISIKESSGGLHMCQYNPFGWGSCKVVFNSLEEAIRTLAVNLGGNNPRTSPYYKGDTRSKLHSYNGTVEAGYEDRVMTIMEKF